jgi:hypothetical protein
VKGLDLTHPRDLGGLLHTVFALLRAHLPVFFTVTALVNVPVVLIVDGVWDRQLAEGPGGSGDLGPEMASMLLLWTIVPALVTALHVMIVLRLSRGEEPGVGPALSSLRGVTGRALAATVVYGLRTALGFVLLIVPGIIWSIEFAFAPQIAVVDDVEASTAMERSRALVRPALWRVAGRLLAAAILFGILTSLPGILVGQVADSPLAYVAMTCVFGTIGVSATALFTTLLMFSLRAEHAIEPG